MVMVSVMVDRWSRSYKLIIEALSAIQGAVLIMEQQNKILTQLRKDLSELLCIQESATVDIAGVEEDELPSDTVLEITTMGEGLEPGLLWVGSQYATEILLKKLVSLAWMREIFTMSSMTNVTMKRLTWQEMSLQLR
jgi:hypothetical protein